MTVLQIVGIMIYVILIIQSVVTMTAFYLKVKKTPILWSLMGCQASIVLWLVLGIFENLIKDTPALPHVVRYTLIILYFLGPQWLLFSLEYLEVIKPKNRYLRWALFIPAILSSLVSFSDHYLYLVIQEMNGNHDVATWGILFNLNVYLMYACVLASIIMIMIRAFSEQKLIKMKLLLMASVALPALVNLLNTLRVIPDLGFDVTPITFVFFVSVISVLVFKYRVIDIMPFASQEVYASIPDAVLIIDKNGKIVDKNPAGRQLFDEYISAAGSNSIQNFIAQLDQNSDDDDIVFKMKDAFNQHEATVFAETISLRDQQLRQRQFASNIVPLKDSAGKYIGKIMTFRDVTEYRLATLNQERVRLAGDLHDSIGDCLNTIISSLEYVQKHFDPPPEVKAFIQVSYEKGVHALVDLRRIVDELMPVDIENNGLIWALESLFKKRKLMNIVINFTYNNIDDAKIRNQKQGEVIYYICQEAIHNAINHGQARTIDIILTADDDCFKLYLSDDGIGCQEVIENKGLSNMRRRVIALGGTIEYGSPSAGGFNLKVTLPATPSNLQINREAGII